MAYTYSALILYTTSAGRFANLTGTPTVTAYDLAGNAISSPSITNIATGVYKVEVTQNDLEDVVFRVVPHADDLAAFPDVAVMQDKVYHVADEILLDTGTDGVVIGAAQTVATVTTLTNLPAVPADWLTAAAVKAEAVTKIQNGLALADQFDFSAVTVVSSVVGTTITILRGDTWDDAHLLNLGDLTDYVSLDFTVKYSYNDTDDDAIIHIRKNASGLNDGLLRLNGAAHTTGTDGSIIIDDVPTGDVTPVLKATVTDDLAPGSCVYDLQKITATNVKTRTTGNLIIISDVTRLVV